MFTAVCANDCTLNTLEDDGSGIIADVVVGKVANSSNSTVRVDDCQRKRNDMCALKKNAITGVYTSCVSWDQDSGRCNLYKEGIFR